MNFGVFRVLGKYCQLVSQKLHFPGLNSSLKKLKNCNAKSQRMHFQSVLIDRVHWPSATVKVVPLYWMCRRVAYLHVAFLRHINIAMVCEKFVNFEFFFVWNLFNCYSSTSKDLWHNWSRQQLEKGCRQPMLGVCTLPWWSCSLFCPAAESADAEEFTPSSPGAAGAGQPIKATAVRTSTVQLPGTV